MAKKNKNKKKKEFSKVLLIQESILIWIVTLALLALAFYCVIQGFFGELPWITAMVSFPWAAYSVSQACYYQKSEKENTVNGITYLLAEKEFQEQDDIDLELETEE
jgi:hypothetical protein